MGLHQSHSVVFKLSGLFALDSFAGGFVMQSFAAYWFYLRFGVRPASLGAVFFGANVMAGISALLASRLRSEQSVLWLKALLPTALSVNHALLFVCSAVALVVDMKVYSSGSSSSLRR